MMKCSRLTKALLISASLTVIVANNGLQAYHPEDHYTGTKSVTVRSLTTSSSIAPDEVTATRSAAPTTSQPSDILSESEENNVVRTLAATAGTWILDTTATTARIVFDGAVDTTGKVACILFDGVVDTTGKAAHVLFDGAADLTKNATRALFDGAVDITGTAVSFVFKATTSAVKAVISSAFNGAVNAANKGALSAFNYLSSGWMR